MEVGKISVKELFQNNLEFEIPIFQRNYEWSNSQCAQLFNDILDSAKYKKNHFISTLVYIQSGNGMLGEPAKYSVIDGQQRLTTLLLIYLALLNFSKNKQKKDEITQFLTLKNKEIKLHSIEINFNKYLKKILHNDDDLKSIKNSKIIQNYNFFLSKITDDNFQLIFDGVGSLIFAYISLSQGEDNPQKIFESLNATGLDLTQADLIKNFILMNFPPDEQVSAYENFWKEIDENSKVKSKNKVSDFVRYFLNLKTQNIAKTSEVLKKFKEYSQEFIYENNLVELLKELKKYSKYYNKIINPKKEENFKIQTELEYIKTLEINVATPFIMQVYNDWTFNKISENTFIEVLKLIQSYVFRRWIMGWQTNVLNNIFTNIYKKSLNSEIDFSNPKKYIKSLQDYLLSQGSDSTKFPNNSEIITALATKNIYNSSKINTKYLLDKLENHGNKEFIPIINSKISIEHIYPQTSEKWDITLDEEEFEKMQEKLHTISNLTLSASNSELSNKTFAEKKEILKESKLWVNKFITKQETWNIETLDKLLKEIQARFIEIWQYPISDEEEKNIFQTTNPTGKKLEYAVIFRTKYEVSSFRELYKKVIGAILARHPEIISDEVIVNALDLNKENLRSSLALEVGNHTHKVEGNLSASSIFERLKIVLKKLDLKDAVQIKFRPQQN